MAQRRPANTVLLLGSILSLLAGQCFGQSTAANTSAGWLNNFEQDLSESLLDQGSRALEIGAFEEAEDILMEALQVAKVNHGLDSLRQAPALELLIESQIALGNWTAVDRNLSYFQWLNNKSYSRNFGDYLAGMSDLSRLLLAASASQDSDNSVRYLIAAKNLNWRAVSAIEATLGEDSPHLIPWLYNIMLTHHYQSSLTTRRFITNYNYKTDDKEIIAGWSLSKNEEMEKSYNIGKENLQRIRTIISHQVRPLPESDPLMLVHLGDWELLFGHDDHALNYYREAHEGMTAVGIDPQRADEFFNRTVVVPEPQLNLTLDKAGGRSADQALGFTAWSPNFLSVPRPLDQRGNKVNHTPGLSAQVRFNFNPQGGLPSDNYQANLSLSPENFEILSTNPDHELIRQQAQQEISMLKLRPRIELGQPVIRESIRLDYYFWPSDEIASAIND